MCRIASALILMIFSTFSPAAAAETAPTGATIPDLQRAEISGDPARPRRHFRVRNAARLAPDEAERIYREIGADLAASYALSGHPAARQYRRWRRYNRAPYPSATHGRRQLNNYASPAAAAYGRFEGAGRLPAGAVIAKDSFAVTKDGAVRPGPLFLMEKMPEGFNYVSGDWRYTMIMPDGSVYGTTKGAHAERVEYCIGCHLAREDQDHLYFVPEGFRPDPARTSD